MKRKMKKTKKIYSEIKFIIKFFIFWKIYLNDLKTLKKNPDIFKEYGMTMFTGRQGDGKTVSLVETLERLRKRYPKAIILTNFGYKNQTQPFTGWNDFFEIRNGTDGVIFAIDEIQNEFSTAQSKNFPESLLGELTQQRKQRIKILSTSQVFTRVAKPLRENTYEVVECKTIAGRWTFSKCFDADDYNTIIDNPDPVKKMKLRRKWRRNFVQTDELRELFASYDKVQRMKKLEYVREKVS